jgi:hypothetical protein
VIATDVVVGEAAPALLLEAVGLVDRRVDIDGERIAARSGSGGPCPFQKLAGHDVELTNMAPGEAAQKDPERRRRQYRMAQDPVCLTSSQCIGIVDRVAA